jgi:hypothetical protein
MKERKDPVAHASLSPDEIVKERGYQGQPINIGDDLSTRPWPGWPMAQMRKAETAPSLSSLDSDAVVDEGDIGGGPLPCQHRPEIFLTDR